MRFGSLFSGIGGLDLGLERAGMTCVFQAENDPYARRVLEKHWPKVFRYDDVRHVHGVAVGPVDLLCGGFPCQGISLAGKGAGLADHRSGLWAEYARIIGEIRPAWVVIENSPALRVRGLRTVLSDLDARGYDAEWDSISAADVGALHLRERIFVVARRQAVADSNVPRLEERVFQPRQHAEQQAIKRNGGEVGTWAVEPDVGRVAYGVSARVDRFRGLGNAVVPQVGEYIGRLILDAASRSISG